MKHLTGNSLAVVSTVLLTLVLTLIITQPAGTGKRAAVNEPAPQTYKAPRTVTYKSDLKTKEAEEKAAEHVPATYRADLTAGSQQEGKFNATVAAVNGIRASPDAETKPQRLGSVLPNSSPEELNGLLGLDEAGWQQVQTVAHEAVNRAQATQIRQEDLGRSEAIVASHLPAGLPAATRNNAILLGKKVLVPNYLIDDEATQADKNKARRSVEPVSYTVERDQVIAYRGQVLTDFDLERLAAVGLTRPAFNLEKTGGVGLLVLLFSVVLFLATPNNRRRSSHPKRAIVFTFGSAVAVTLLGAVVTPAQPILAYVVPVAAPVLLARILYGPAAAPALAIVLSAFYALASGGSFELFFIHLAAATLTVGIIRQVNNTATFMRMGLVVAASVFVGMVAFSLLAGNFNPANLPKFLLAAGLNGALTTTFVFAGAAFLAGPLGALTFLQLQELENPRQPLLRRLAREAPGTYSHSLRMAGLVENVAEEVGADSLLARVQTLYHDIGKISLPEYFIENQRQGKNPHASLTPKESAETLRAHISEGLSLAKEAGVPDRVAAAIPEHHGTTRMGFFWEAAKRAGGRPHETDYRYLGPKPHSKETAIIMLADAVEAASRTLEAPDERKVSKLVDQLVSERVDDGQFDNAPITTHELTVLREAFTRIIINDLHKRIRYPEKTNA